MMIEDAERKDTKSESPDPMQAGMTGGIAQAPVRHGPLPTAGVVRSKDELLDPNQVYQIRNANLDGQLRSNFWFEVSRISMWATTALMALSVGVVYAGMQVAASSAAGTTAAAATAALAGIPVALPLIGAAIAATVLVISSQHSKKIFANRWFDVQDFQMQRQAALLGQAVEKANDKTHDEEVAHDKQWTDRLASRAGRAESWEQTVTSQPIAQLDSAQR